jgi:hypothetical protein
VIRRKEEHWTSDLQYRLDAQDKICSVNEEWHSFAAANEARNLLASDIIGRQLWDFIGDIETQHIYRELHRRVRTQSVPVRLSFRCDGPERRRLLQLDIHAEEGQELIYHIRTLKEELRPPVPLLDSRQPRSESFVTMCGWCKRVAAPSRGWLEVEEAVAELGLFAEPRPPQLTHGVCKECSESLWETLEDRRDRPVLGGW